MLQPVFQWTRVCYFSYNDMKGLMHGALLEDAYSCLKMCEGSSGDKRQCVCVVFRWNLIQKQCCHIFLSLFF